MIPYSEYLTVEFKSDRKRLSGVDLAEVLVCLDNTEADELWLGVEDDGQATSLHVEHMDRTGLAGMVAAQPIAVIGAGCPSETFRILKIGELREIDEYRTQRLVLAAWDRLETGEKKSC